jgi:heme A synthase
MEDAPRWVWRLVGAITLLAWIGYVILAAIHTEPKSFSLFVAIVYGLFLGVLAGLGSFIVLSLLRMIFGK